MKHKVRGFCSCHKLLLLLCCYCCIVAVVLRLWSFPDYRPFKTNVIHFSSIIQWKIYWHSPSLLVLKQSQSQIPNPTFNCILQKKTENINWKTIFYIYVWKYSNWLEVKSKVTWSDSTSNRQSSHTNTCQPFCSCDPLVEKELAQLRTGSTRVRLSSG